MASHIIPFRRHDPQPDPLAYAEGVAPFDRSNAAHIQAWNTIWAIGLSERKKAQQPDCAAEDGRS